ncbi:MAG: hypothetical protein NW206_06510 [Hyphomonadaceae bacterium]|nr:hypothetical protein [Hyphomonadaceae bacterium]
MKPCLVLIATALTLTACASVQRTLTYPSQYADAAVTVGGHPFAIWFHEEDPTILIQRGPGQSLNRALAQNWTMYANDQSEPEVYWRVAANAVLQPMGCQALEVTGADQMREVSFRCLEGVNIKQEVAARRDGWRQGLVMSEPRPAY